MGYASTEDNVVRLLNDLEKHLTRQGFKTSPGSGVAGALQVLRKP
jgi:aspartate aminotransferase-like enzyme